jgi:hypothetical protein
MFPVVKNGRAMQQRVALQLLNFSLEYRSRDTIATRINRSMEKN